MPRKIKGRNGGTLVIPDKGTTPNPNGRPPGPNRATIVKAVLDMGFDVRAFPDKVRQQLFQLYPTLKTRKTPLTVEEVMVIIQTSKAILNQDTYAFNSLMDSKYGRLKNEKEEEESGTQGQRLELGRLLRAEKLEPADPEQVFEDAEVIDSEGEKTPRDK